MVQKIFKPFIAAVFAHGNLNKHFISIKIHIVTNTKENEKKVAFTGSH